MSTIVPKSKSLERAMQWIAQERRERPDVKLFALVSEASQRFDLSPMEGERLFTTIKAEIDALARSGGE